MLGENWVATQCQLFLVSPFLVKHIFLEPFSLSSYHSLLGINLERVTEKGLASINSHKNIPMILAPNNCPCSANHRDYLEIDAIAYSGIAILTLSFSSPKSKHADSELPEHVKCQTHDARKQEFRALTEPFTTRYQAPPEPAPTYTPD